jgi:hypothetical protein
MIALGEELKGVARLGDEEEGAAIGRARRDSPRSY